MPAKITRLDEVFDENDDEPEDPSAESEGFNEPAPIQLKRPFEGLGDLLAPEACSELARLNPSQTRFRVYLEIPPEQIPEDADDSEPLYGYTLVQSAKPCTVAGASLLHYLRNAGFVGNIALEWLPPGKSKLLHFLQVGEPAPVQQRGMGQRAQPDLRTLLDSGGNSQQALLLAFLEIIERKDRASQERMDNLMREMRDQTNDLIRAMRENDPVRELGQQMVRAGNEAVMSAVTDTIARSTGKKSELSELSEKLHELERLKGELAPLLGGDRAPEKDDVEQLLKLGQVIQMFRGGGGNSDGQLSALMGKLDSAGESLLDTA